MKDNKTNEKILDIARNSVNFWNHYIEGLLAREERKLATAQTKKEIKDIFVKINHYHKLIEESYLLLIDLKEVLSR